MHIEPGYLAPTKILLANVAALGLSSYYLKSLIERPRLSIRTLLATLFFSLFMQSFHIPVGPSELHFIGAMAIYLTLGYLPTLLGFAFGLALQGLLFNPTDLLHLAVNSLSLMLPLIAVHHTVGRRLQEQTIAERRNWKAILKLDACYYSGVTAMVGFWLLLSEVATPIAAWASFAVSYLAIVAIEPLVTLLAMHLLHRFRQARLVAVCFAVTAH